MTDQPEWILFASQAEAEQADHQISVAAGFTDPKTATMRWAVPVELVDGRWGFPAPDLKYRAAVTVPHTVEPMQADWFPVVEQMP
jgi:hypothetical protein